MDVPAAQRTLAEARTADVLARTQVLTSFAARLKFGRVRWWELPHHSKSAQGLLTAPTRQGGSSELNPEFGPKRSGGEEVGSATGGQEVVHGDFIGQIQDAETGRPVQPVGVKQVVGPDA